MLTYLKEHITEEIEGAIDYMTKAVEHKGTHCGEIFYEMAKMELEHANQLTRIFKKTDKPVSMTDAEHASIQKAVLTAYMDGMTKIESLKKLYWEI